MGKAGGDLGSRRVSAIWETSINEVAKPRFAGCREVSHRREEEDGVRDIPESRVSLSQGPGVEIRRIS